MKEELKHKGKYMLSSTILKNSCVLLLLLRVAIFQYSRNQTTMSHLYTWLPLKRTELEMHG